jgi:hypothetical protein
MATKNKQRISSPLILRALASTLVISSILGVSVHLQPVSTTHLQLRPQTTSATKTASHNVPRKPSVTQPAATSKAVSTPTKSSAQPAATTSSSSSPKAQPVVTPSPSSNVSGLTPSVPATTPSTPSTPATTTSYDSTNWSGYMATTGSYSAISASWTATSPTGNGSTTSADSTWIGIGGVTTSDLIQVGTQNIVAANGQVSPGAFYELLPNVSQTVPGITVAVGDTMSASLTQISAGQWTIHIVDTTNGESYTSTVTYASSNSSAEWIEEDPSFSSRRLIPFDNFGTASFTGGSTVASGSTVNIAGSNAQPITMVNQADQPIATPSAIGSSGASFSVTQN